jgi:uncharacterized C2H2 Zn-finger protein
MGGAAANHSDSAFEEWRQDHAFRAELEGKRARGEKLPSEQQSTLMRCPCGAVFDSWRPYESYQHRWHIYAAQKRGAARW